MQQLQYLFLFACMMSTDVLDWFVCLWVWLSNDWSFCLLIEVHDFLKRPVYRLFCPVLSPALNNSAGTSSGPVALRLAVYMLITYSEFIGTEPGPVDPWTHLNAAEMKCCQIYLSCMLCCCCCVCVTELDKSRLLLQRPGCRWVGTSHTHVLLRHIADCFLDALHLLLSRRPVSLHDCLSQSFCSNLTDSISWMQPV